jgi:hypothetical protein
MREFSSGATRDSDTDKLDPEGFFSPEVIVRFSEYMNKHRHQADGKTRTSDNWQKGMGKDVFMKSAWRHFLDWWCLHRGVKAPSSNDIEETICAVIFNAQGYLYEILKNKFAIPDPEEFRKAKEYMDKALRDSVASPGMVSSEIKAEYSDTEKSISAWKKRHFWEGWQW